MFYHLLRCLWGLMFVIHCSSADYRLLISGVRGTDENSRCDANLIGSADIFPDSSFTASSVRGDKQEFQPYQARMTSFFEADEFSFGKAWCPANPIDPMRQEWIQIEFSELNYVMAIFTKGLGNGNYVNEFVRNYIIEYQREDHQDWQPYKGKGSSTHRIIRGNGDPRNTGRWTFKPPLISRRLRIIPVEVDNVSRPVCLRLALQGCSFHDGVVDYNAPLGDDSIYPLKDNLYDGLILNGRTVNGLGKLTDNLIFSGQTKDFSSLKPDLFVGWGPNLPNPIELIFRFDVVRHFQQLSLHLLIEPIIMMNAFSTLSISFSIGGIYYDQREEPVIVSEPQIVNQWIRIALHQRMGKFAKIKVSRDLNSWIAMDEVEFITTAVSQVIEEEVNPNVPTSKRDQTKEMTHSPGPASGNPDSSNSDSSNFIHQGMARTTSPPPISEASFVILIIGCFFGSLLCAVLVAIGFLRLRHQRRKKSLIRASYKDDSNYHNNHTFHSQTHFTLLGSNPPQYSLATALPVSYNGAVCHLSMSTPSNGANSINHYATHTPSNVNGASLTLTQDSETSYNKNSLVSTLHRNQGGDATCPVAISASNMLLESMFESQGKPLLKENSLYTDVASSSEDEENCSPDVNCDQTVIWNEDVLPNCNTGTSRRVMSPSLLLPPPPHTSSAMGGYGVMNTLTNHYSPPTTLIPPYAAHPMPMNLHIPMLVTSTTATANNRVYPLMPAISSALPVPASMDTSFLLGSTLPRGLHTVSVPQPMYLPNSQGCYTTNPVLGQYHQQGNYLCEDWQPTTLHTNFSPTHYLSASNYCPTPPLPEFSCKNASTERLAMELQIQSVTGGNIYATHRRTPLSTGNAALTASNRSASNEQLSGKDNNVTPLEALLPVSKQQLRLMEKLGGGEFGEVHLAEWFSLVENSSEVQTNTSSHLVAIKMLRPDANEQARRDFQNEVNTLRCFHHANIVQLLGVCHDTDSPWVLTEYMPYGDLHHFLRDRYPSSADLMATEETIKRYNVFQQRLLHEFQQAHQRHGKGEASISYSCLIFMATQIASGMKYLDSHGFVHRDLACRNCLVGEKFAIKIADFGMCRRLYENDYYKVQGKLILPIRWMAWESLLQGVFTPKTDVWSFGVTLWEMLTFCRHQPFDDLTNEQVIENCARLYTCTVVTHVLPCPPNCPKELYDLMLECWQKNDSRRPSFSEIHMFLQRKISGYSADTEYKTIKRYMKKLLGPQ